jgi:Family of unknown function (DUF6176)
MEYRLWVFPLIKGKENLFKDVCAETMRGARRPAMEASQRKHGLVVDMMFVWHGPDRSYLIVYMASDDMTNSLKSWAQSQDEFDVWNKNLWPECIDPADMPDPMWAEPGTGGVPELIFAWDNGPIDLD